MTKTATVLGLLLGLILVAPACSSSSTTTPAPVDHCGARTCGSDGFGGSCGECFGTEVCSQDGACVTPSPKPCGPGNPSGTCAAGSTCFTDPSGNTSCAVSCSKNASCTKANSCCTLLKNGGGVCQPAGSFTGQQCLCQSPTECASGVCGETSNASGNPLGSSVCVPNDGKPYHGCKDGVMCQSGCCITIGDKTNFVCAEACTDSTQCGGRTCSMLTGGNCNGSPGVCQ